MASNKRNEKRPDTQRPAFSTASKDVIGESFSEIDQLPFIRLVAHFAASASTGSSAEAQAWS
jgi:hypothetical protein